MMSMISSFWKNNVVGQGSPRDFGRGSGKPVNPALAAAGGAAAGAVAGAVLGAVRGAGDVVTVEYVPYQETVNVPVGERTVNGCYQYHYGYDALEGEFGYHWGYDASCVDTETVYDTHQTGRTLHNEVKHHSLGFPRNALQGSLIGLGVGAALGVAGAVLYNVARSS